LPEGGAPGKHALALLRGLAAHGVEATALAADQYHRGEPPPDLRIELVAVPAPARRAPTAILRRPRGALAEGPLGRRVAELAPSVDVLHLEQTETAWCDAGIATPSAVHVHYRVTGDRGLDALLRPGAVNVLEARLSERAALRRHRFLLASSPLVAADLRHAAPGAEVVHAPLGLDDRLYPPAPLDGPPLAGVIGTASWPPTRAALVRLLDRVWPRIRRLVPDARLLVAGRGTDALTDRAGAEILGEVPSAQAFLARLSVLVYPLTRGTGMKVKVLEALASGIPIVTTAAGAEGIDGGEGVIVADDDDELASAAACLLVDEDERRARGRAAREAFLHRYTPSAVAEPVVRLYERMTR
jgi:glycosyltransferase involved in cell wall biosynthesis